jgi:hypothetical protein
VNAGPTLFDRVVAATGLNELVAPFTVSRLLVRAGVEPRELTGGDLQQALPELEQGIRVYLSRAECEQAMTRLRALCREQS